MFYQLQILSKKGKLARVWLAAHHEKKLTKAHIMTTDIPRVVEDIMKSFEPMGKQEEVRMSLRLLGFLLLGTVKIHYKKADYLLKDCNDALVNIKLAFRPGAKQDSANVANPTSITLREPDEEMVDFNMDLDLPFESLQDVEIEVAVDEMVPIDSYQAARTAITQADYEDIHMEDLDELPDDIGYVGAEFGEADLGEENPYEDMAAGEFQTEINYDDLPAPELPEVPPPAPEEQDAITEAIQAAYERQEASGRTARVVPVREDKLRTLSTKLMKRNIEDYTPIVNENRSLVPRTKRLKVHEDAAAEDVTVSFAKPGITVIAGFDSAIAGLFSKMAAPAPMRRRPSMGGFVHRDDDAPVEADHYDPEDAYIPDIDMGSPGGPRDSFGGDQQRREEEGPEEGFYEDYNQDYGDMGDDLPQDEEERRPHVPAPVTAHKSVTKRTLTMHKFLTKNFASQESLSYFELVKNKKRSTAAQMFFELLVLKTRDCVDVAQETPYGDIKVTKNQEHFDSLVTV
mmetsp:Transcript_638/g.2253  ORF Transcript_638/g.2253 Transcript_638/m.2253 type:complete len:514 (-) Transcript_638:125-1666(-)